MATTDLENLRSSLCLVAEEVSKLDPQAVHPELFGTLVGAVAAALVAAENLVNDQVTVLEKMASEVPHSPEYAKWHYQGFPNHEVHVGHFCDGLKPGTRLIVLQPER